MQEQLLHAAEPGRRPAGQQFVGVDLRRPKGYAAPAQQQQQQQPPATAEGSPCPRCESRDTKFCYYNNYNTSQPRYFCKCCRRYWTKGGTLRNVPVGGGTRKKPSSSSSSSSSPSSASPPAAKRHKPSKKRVVAAPPATSADNDAVAAAPDSAKTTTETTTTKTATPPTDAASEITTELVVPAGNQEDSFTDFLQQGDVDNTLALDLGFSDYPTASLTLKQLGDPDSFEWPPAFDLNPYWSSTGAAFPDPDPGLFMNLP